MPSTDTNSDEHRWLVSYADYMTLMFAFFVVMYALSIVKEEEFSVLSDTIEDVFEQKTAQQEATVGTGVEGEGLLNTNNTPTEETRYGSSIALEQKGPELVDGHGQLSNLKQKLLGNPLDSLEQELKNAISDELEMGQAKIERDQDWLTIQLDSSLLFGSGSAVLMNSARTVLRQLLPVINQNRNYLRIRGYTDDLPINNELFQSNWHLSVARATSVLIALESIGVLSGRMAIEGYGQYSPLEDNATPQGRSANRKVIIAISKYALPEENKPETVQQESSLPATRQQVDVVDNELKVIQLPHGGIRVTTREEKQ